MECSAQTEGFSLKVKSKWGTSLQGPTSDAEIAGILEATKDLRPPKDVKLKFTMQGAANEIRTWNLNDEVLSPLELCNRCSSARALFIYEHEYTLD